MSIRIQLQEPRSLYTNLDFIRGKAILSLTRTEDITAVNVKLEGESKSRLEGEPPDPYGFGGLRRRREELVTETEVHKVRPIALKSIRHWIGSHPTFSILWLALCPRALYSIYSDHAQLNRP